MHLMSSQLHQGKMTTWNSIPLLRERLALRPSKVAQGGDRVISPVCVWHACNANGWLKSGLAAPQ